MLNKITNYINSKPKIDRFFLKISITLLLTSYQKDKHLYFYSNGSFSKKDQIKKEDKEEAGNEIKKWTTRYIIVTFIVSISTIIANISLTRTDVNLMYYIILFIIIYYSSSRIIEGVYSLSKDAFSFIDKSDDKKTLLTPKERLELLIKNYFETIINFGLIYYAIQFFSINKLSSWKAGDANWIELFDCIYLSFVTITTLGYGEIVPANNFTKTLVMIELCCGILLIVVTFGLYSSYGNNNK